MDEALRLTRISEHRDEFVLQVAFEPGDRRFMGRPVWRFYLTQNPLHDTISFVFPAGTNVLPALLRRAYGGSCSNDSCSLLPTTEGGLRAAAYGNVTFEGQPTAMPTIQCFYNMN